MAAEFIIGVVKPDTGRVLLWEGIFNKDELQARINSGNPLPAGYKIYKIKEVALTVERKTVTMEVDEVTIGDLP